METLSEAAITAALDRHAARNGQVRIEGGDMRPGAQTRRAAVLIPFVQAGGEWHILLTRRTDLVQDHKGQVSFPGGGVEARDRDITATALRETHEELGIDPGDVRVLGRSGDYLTISDYLVTPVVGTLPWPYPLRLEPREVSRAFTIPLGWLRQAENREERTRLVKGIEAQVIFFHPYDGEVVWGATARMLVEMLARLEA
jgi:8-oxo-dGTP pyrophosphatase MutT (NUDIX family)